MIVAPDTKEPGTLTEPKQFNLMFQTTVGATGGPENVAYLRPETAQGIFLNYKNVLDTTASRSRHRPDREGLPQRGDAPELHLPKPRVRADGDGVVLPPRRRREVV